MTMSRPSMALALGSHLPGALTLTWSNRGQREARVDLGAADDADLFDERPEQRLPRRRVAGLDHLANVRLQRP